MNQGAAAKEQGRRHVVCVLWKGSRTEEASLPRSLSRQPADFRVRSFIK